MKLNSQPKVVEENGRNQWRVFVKTVLRVIGPTSGTSGLVFHLLFAKCYFLFMVIQIYVF